MSDIFVNIILFPDTFIILFLLLTIISWFFVFLDERILTRKNILISLFVILMISFIWMHFSYNNVILKKYYTQTWEEIINERWSDIELDDLKKLDNQKDSLFLVKNRMVLEYIKIPKFLESRVKNDLEIYWKYVKRQEFWNEYKEAKEETQKNAILDKYKKD